MQKLQYLKTLSLEACQNLAQIPSESTHAARQFRCAELLQYALEPGTLRQRLNRANFCKQRSCPVCGWLRSTKVRLKIFRGLPALLAAYPRHRFIFLTLTLKNCHFQLLRLQIKAMEKAWIRLTNAARFPAVGFLKTVEVTRPRDCFYGGHYIGRMGAKAIADWKPHLPDAELWQEYWCEECHPHMHILLLVPPDYFSNRVEHSEWVALWQRAARLDYKPVVHVESVTRLGNAVLEVSKYCVKSSQMVDLIGCFITRNLHGLRLMSLGGVFSDYLSQRAIDAIVQTGQLGTEHWQSGVPCWYEWDGDDYQLIRLASQEWEVA